jgi:hypothetical protein
VTTILDKALDLAAQGLPVFPCASTKKPTAPHGFLDATADFPGVIELWRLYPGELIGVPTGAVSGLDVVDLDLDHLPARLWLHMNRTRLPETRTHSTRRVGLHQFFRHQHAMGCSSNRIAVGVDVRADGGYVIWWPAAGLAIPCQALPAEWPEWLITQALPRVRVPVPTLIAAPPRGREVRGESDISRYGDIARKRAAARILRAPNGLQEATINREAFSLGTLIAANVVEKDDAYRDLLAIADHVPSLVPSRPWAPGQVRHKIERALAQGMRHPRPARNQRTG